MIQSKFEKFNDNALKKILVVLLNALLEEGVEDPIRHNLEDEEVFEIVENTIKMMGFEPEWDDIDFIFALYSLNFNSFNEESKLSIHSTVSFSISSSIIFAILDIRASV